MAARSIQRLRCTSCFSTFYRRTVEIDESCGEEGEVVSACEGEITRSPPLRKTNCRYDFRRFLMIGNILRWVVKGRRQKEIDEGMCLCRYRLLRLCCCLCCSDCLRSFYYLCRLCCVCQLLLISVVSFLAMGYVRLL